MSTNANDDANTNDRANTKRPLVLPVVVLAAGKGVRMGSPKGLVVHPTTGEAFLEWQVGGLDDAALPVAVVVLGHGLATYRERVPFVRGAEERAAVVGAVSVRVLVNPDPDRGPFSSLVIGLEHVVRAHADFDGVFVLPVDVPCPLPSTWHALIDAFVARRPGERVFVPSVARRGGHPVLLDAGFAREVVGDTNGPGRLDRAIDALGPAAKVHVAVDDPRAVLDLNTPDDFARWAR